MGTSSSSSGPGPNVPYDPPWIDDIDPEKETNKEQQKPKPTELASPRRFSNARRQLGQYVKTGEQSSFRKAMGYYSRDGMGGASNVANRLRFSTSVGATLYNILQEGRNNSDPKIKDWINQLPSKNLSAHQLAEELIDQVVSKGGSLEEESCRDSIDLALSELLNIYPDVDLMNMNTNNTWMVIELFIVNEAFNRLYLDIGQLFESDKFTPQAAVSKLNDMKDYLKAEITAQMQDLRNDKYSLTHKEMNLLLQSALKITFEIFEEEL